MGSIRSYKELRVYQAAMVEELDDLYDKILGQLVRMMAEAEQWTIRW